MTAIIREMEAHEYPLLQDFLYEAIFQRDETNLAPRTICNDPALQIYTNDFGSKKDDFCLCAEVDQKVIGAVWVRNIHGYGNVGEDTPEFAISLYRNYRNRGIGTELMKRMLALLRSKGYKKASLAVQKENYAFRMYRKIGFAVVGESEEEYIMQIHI